MGFNGITRFGHVLKFLIVSPHIEIFASDLFTVSGEIMAFDLFWATSTTRESVLQFTS